MRQKLALSSTCKSIIFLARQKQEPSPPYFNGSIPKAFPALYLDCAGWTPPRWLCTSASWHQDRAVGAITAHTRLPLLQTCHKQIKSSALGSHHTSRLTPPQPLINANLSSFKDSSLCVRYKKKPLLSITRRIGTGSA